MECMLALVEARVEPAAEWAPVQMEARVGPLAEGQRRRAPWADPARVVRQRPASRR